MWDAKQRKYKEKIMGGVFFAAALTSILAG